MRDFTEVVNENHEAIRREIETARLQKASAYKALARRDKQLEIVLDMYHALKRILFGATALILAAQLSIIVLMITGRLSTLSSAVFIWSLTSAWTMFFGAFWVTRSIRRQIKEVSVNGRS